MMDIHRRSYTFYMMELDGESLSPAQRAEMQAHLSSCSSCQLDRLLYQGLHAQAMRRWPVVATPPEMASRLRSVRTQTIPHGLAYHLHTLVLVGLAVLALIVVQWLFTNLRPSPAILPVSSPTPQVFDSPAVEVGVFSLLAADGRQDYDYYGAAVDIDGGVLVAGAPFWNSPGMAAGSVYVFRRSPEGQWLAETVLAASDRDDGIQHDQHFGEAVAIQGNVIAVGAPGADDAQAGDNTGAVYIFEYDGQTWVETGKLTPDIKSSNAKIGRVIAFDGDYLAASGAPEARSVSIFQRGPEGWREMTPIIVPAFEEGHTTYALLDLYGDTLAVSTISWNPAPDPLDEDSQLVWIQSLKITGVVSLYERAGDEWAQVFQTSPQEASLYPLHPDIPFGLPVALSGDAGKANLLAIGKPGFPKSARESGSVAIYERGDNGWQPQSELMLAPGNEVPGSFGLLLRLNELFSNPAASFFGTYIDMDGNRLAVISTFANAAYVFEKIGQEWVYQCRVTPGADYGDDFQRRTVALDGNVLMMGSPGELGGGKAFVFRLSD